MMYFVEKLIMNTAKTKYFLFNQIKNEQNVKI